MIVGCYTLDLYCDHPECRKELTAIGERVGECKKKARREGWSVGKKQAWCPTHAKGKR